MRLAVIGGTGVLGSAVVEDARGRGDEVVILSRSAPSTGALSDVEHRAVDLAYSDADATTRLATAVEGADAVIDAVNSTPHARSVLVEGNRRLLAAEVAAGVEHHVAISIVGCDQVPVSYYRAKVEQEQVVSTGAVPWSMIRVTQFHNLVDSAFRAVAKLGLRPVAPAPLQPIDVSVAAAHMVDAAHNGPAGRLPNLAGPEIRTVTELSNAWRRAMGRRLLPVRVPLIGGMARAVKAGMLCDEEAAAGGLRFEEWLADRNRQLVGTE